MFIKIFSTGSFQSNTILLADVESKLAVLIDPGEQANLFVKEIKKQGFTLQSILLTHAHIDHIMGLAQVKNVCPCEVWLHKYDEPLFVNSGVQAQAMGINWKDNLPTINRYFDDQDMITCGALSIRVLHTPGHSAGSVCFEIAERAQHAAPLLITGDTLFAGAVGRTDLWGGKAYQLKESLKKLKAYPDNTRVIPGHGPETTIGREKKENPYLAELRN